jgi:hypothetical protein
VTFVVSQLVVTIADWSDQGIIGTPKRGVVYTIRSIEPFPEGLALRFVEIVNPPMKWSTGFFGEAGYAAEFFRPVVEGRIAVFRALLETRPNSQPVKEREPASA